MFRDVLDIAPVTRGLGALWHSDMGLSLNGLAASALADQSSNGGNLAQGTAASQPTVVPGAIGARTALRFDGSNDQLSRAVFNGAKPSARGFSAVFVAQGRSGSTGDYPVLMSERPWTAANDVGWAISANGSAASGFFTTHFDSGVVEAGGWDHATFPATRGLSTTQRELWCVVFDITNGKLRYYRNGALDVERSPTYPVTTPIVPTADFRIGADLAPGAVTRILAMDFYAGSLHTEPLTEDEVVAIASRWMPLYGVAP